MLDQGTTALLFGKWGTAKSFIGFDWAASVATGRKWQGRRVAQRRALYIAAEGAFGLKGRSNAWETGWQTEIHDGQLEVSAAGEPHPLRRSRCPGRPHRTNGYGLVVLDTLARCMVGADENTPKDVGLVIDAMTRLLQHTPDGRGVVLGVHHTGKDGKTLRGSSAFEGGVDTAYLTTRDGAVITLES